MELMYYLGNATEMLASRGAFVKPTNRFDDASAKGPTSCQKRTRPVSTRTKSEAA
jgi:hypothetical protein